MLWFACVGLFALPAEAQAAERVPVQKEATQQKAIYLEKLLASSVGAQTIESRGDSNAKAKLAEARDLVREAKGALVEGRLEHANRLLDQALGLVNSEVRKLSKSKVKGKRLRQAYEKRLSAVKTFVKAYRHVAENKEMTAATRAQIDSLEGLVVKAEALAQDGQLSDAKAVLDRAYQETKRDIRTMREGATLTRTLNFKTPEEEYRYEEDRNDSHIMLLKFAITDKQPPKIYRDRIAVLKKEAAEKRNEAERLAKSGDYQSAIGSLENSTDTLKKAIRICGIFIPG